MSKPKMCKEKLKRVRIKICGLKRAEDVPLCHQFGVDMVGFVTEYPLPVPQPDSRKNKIFPGRGAASAEKLSCDRRNLWENNRLGQGSTPSLYPTSLPGNINGNGIYC